MSYTIMIQAAQLALQAVADRQKSIKDARMISGLLRQNNAILLESIKNIIRAQFSQTKLEEANNRMQSLAIFTDEVDSEDYDKLRDIEMECQYILNIFDDDDIKYSGIVNYLTTAGLRLNALVLRSKKFPNDLSNAKKRAKEYYNYAEAFPNELKERVKHRFGIFSFSEQYVRTDIDTDYYVFIGYYKIDGRYTEAYRSGESWKISSNTKTQVVERTKKKKQQHIEKEIKKLPLKEIAAARNELKNFFGS